MSSTVHGPLARPSRIAGVLRSSPTLTKFLAVLNPFNIKDGSLESILQGNDVCGVSGSFGCSGEGVEFLHVFSPSAFDLAGAALMCVTLAGVLT